MKTTYRAALHDALRDALNDDPSVLLLGEDVGRYGGTYAVSKGLLDEFGPDRVRDTPLSELGFVASESARRSAVFAPIVEVMTVNFSLLALDQIVNTAAALRHMSGGQFSVPLVVRMATGAGRQLAAQHSHSLVRPHSRHQGRSSGDCAGRVRHAWHRPRRPPRSGDLLRARRALQHRNRRRQPGPPHRHFPRRHPAVRIRCHGDHLRWLPAQSPGRGQRTVTGRNRL